MKRKPCAQNTTQPPDQRPTSLSSLTRDQFIGGSRLRQGSTGIVVARLQSVLTNTAAGQWETTPGPIDEHFGPKTAKAVKAFQKFAGVKATGVVENDTWAAAIPSLNSTLATTVGVDGRPQLSAWRRRRTPVSLTCHPGAFVPTPAEEVAGSSPNDGLTLPRLFATPGRRNYAVAVATLGSVDVPQADPLRDSALCAVDHESRRSACRKRFLLGGPRSSFLLRNPVVVPPA